jgi:hypothetical protein
MQHLLFMCPQNAGRSQMSQAAVRARHRRPPQRQPGRHAAPPSAWNYRISTTTSVPMVDAGAFEMDETEESELPLGSRPLP